MYNNPYAYCYQAGASTQLNVPAKFLELSFVCILRHNIYLPDSLPTFHFGGSENLRTRYNTLGHAFKIPVGIGMPYIKYGDTHNRYEFKVTVLQSDQSGKNGHNKTFPTVYSPSQLVKVCGSYC